MSRARPRPARSRQPAGRDARPGRRRPAGLVVAGVVLLVGLAAVILLGPRRQAPGPPGVSPTATEFAILDSIKAANARRDWVSTLSWVERLGRTRPHDPAVLHSRGTAWSNYAVDQRPRRVHPRPALRTSLERTECLRRAVGLMDSSTRLAVEPVQWLESAERLAELYEGLGLPGDALAAYETIEQRLPDELAPAMRAYWLRTLFHDPVSPDTSAYQVRMKRLGRDAPGHGRRVGRR